MKTTPLILLAVACATPTLGHAQIIIDQQRPDRRPPEAPAARVAPPEPKGPEPKSVVQAGPEAPATPLKRVIVEGSSLPPEAFAAASQPLIGKPLNLETVKAAANAAASVYADSDIVLYTVFAPGQDLSGGELRLRAVEGYISQVALQGDVKGRDLKLVKAMAGKITRGKPLRKRDMQRYLSLIRDIPGLTVEPNLLRGVQPGAVVLALTLKQKRTALDFAVNNAGSRILGRNQFQATANLYGLLREGDQTALTVGVPSDIERFQYYAITHSQPLGSEGLRIQANAAYLRTRPDNPPSRGSAKLAGVQLSYPLIRSYETNLYLTGGIDGLNSDNAVFGQGTASERTRTLRASAAFTHAKPKRVLSASAVGSQGLKGLGARTNPILAKQDFQKLNLRAGADQALGKAFVVRVRGMAQLSGDLLPSSEQVSLGGTEFGRAFETALVLGDRGYAGSAELGFRPQKLPSVFKGSEVYGFVDGGKVTYKARFIFPQQDFDMSSAGAGVRLAFNEKTMIGVEGAWALKGPVPRYDDAKRLGLTLRVVR